MAIEKINEGISGEQAANIIYSNDLQALTKEEAGYTPVPANTEWATELINSEITDTSIWYQNRTYSPTTGALGSAVQNGYVASVKKYPIPQGNFEFTTVLGIITGSAGLCLYDENEVFIKTVNSYQTPVEFNTEGAKYFTVTHRVTLPVTIISVKNNNEVYSDENIIFAKKSESATKAELAQTEETLNNSLDTLAAASVTKSELGISSIPANTEWATELRNSSPADPEIWYQDRVYSPSTGALSAAGNPTYTGYMASVKKYPIPQGNFEFTAVMQIVSGTTGLCLYDENEVFIKTVNSLMVPVEFNTEGAKYFTVTHRANRPVNLISVRNNNDIPFLDNPLFIPSSKEDEFMKKGDVIDGLVFDTFSQVEEGENFPTFCDVGNFSLARNTDVKTGNVLNDYNIRGQNFAKLNKAKVINTKELEYIIYDVDGTGALLSVNGKNVMTSNNGGDTWTLLATVPEANFFIWVAALENGEILLVDRTIRGDTPATDSIGGIYVSSNGRTVFTKTLTYRNRYILPFPSWGLEQNGADIYFSEYGNSPESVTGSDPEWNLGSKADANHIWKSDNYGASFSVLVKLNELPIFPNDRNLHIHGIHFDKFWNRLWVTTGDGGGKAISNKKLAWTDDGVTWGGIELSNYYAGDPAATGTTPLENLQGLSMYSTNEALLIGSDCWHNAVFRVNKFKREKVVLEDAYYPTPDVWNDITYFTGKFTRYAGSPVFIPFGAGDASTEIGRNSRHPKIVATWDGVDFVEIWKDENTPQGIPQDSFRVFKLLGRYYIQARYPALAKTYLIEIEL